MLYDYAFLADPEGRTEFLIERDGSIWKPDADTGWSPRGRKRNPSLLDWRSLVDAKAKWSYLDRAMPVLQIGCGERKLQLFACSGRGFALIGNRCFDLESGQTVPRKTGEGLLAEQRMQWHRRFGGIAADTFPRGHVGKLIRTGMTLAESIFAGPHPRYGVAYYGRQEHDGFPPTVIRACQCLTHWHCNHRAEEILEYYLRHFIDEHSGEIKYYGPSLAEYGMLLTLTAKFLSRPPKREVYHSGGQAMTRFLQLCLRDSAQDGLLIGSPEADEAADRGVFIHNNAWVAKGLQHWGKATKNEKILSAGMALQTRLRKAVDTFKRQCGFIPWRLDGQMPLPENFHATRQASYANYRYYPELLESGFLTAAEAAELVAYRKTRGGEKEGATLFFNKTGCECPPEWGSYHFDNWTLYSYAAGLRLYGFLDELKRVLDGHIRLCVSRDTGVVYEQVSANQGVQKAWADVCVPALLVLPMIHKLTS